MFLFLFPPDLSLLVFAFQSIRQTVMLHKHLGEMEQQQPERQWWRSTPNADMNNGDDDDDDVSFFVLKWNIFLMRPMRNNNQGEEWEKSLHSFLLLFGKRKSVSMFCFFSPFISLYTCLWWIQIQKLYFSMRRVRAPHQVANRSRSVEVSGDAVAHYIFIHM